MEFWGNYSYQMQLLVLQFKASKLIRVGTNLLLTVGAICSKTAPCIGSLFPL